MNQQGRVMGFVIDESFGVALRMLRRALALEGLRVPHEFDAAARVKQELGIVVKQHMVLYVDDPIHLLEAAVMHPAAGLFIPEPVVLSTATNVCRVSVRSIEPVFATDLPASVRGAVSNLHERILSAVQRIALKDAGLAA
jgi:uncharacterized protein (DUF302 family)